jgi:hypothetical protein
MTTRFGDYLDRRWWMRLLSLFTCLIRIEFCNSSASCWGCCTKVAIPILMNDVDLKPSYVPVVTVEMSLHILNIIVFKRKREGKWGKSLGNLWITKQFRDSLILWGRSYIRPEKMGHWTAHKFQNLWAAWSLFW